MVCTIRQGVPTVHPRTQKISPSITLERTDQYVSITVEIQGGTDQYASLSIKTLVLPGRGQSTYRYLLGPVCTAYTGRYISKLRTLILITSTKSMSEHKLKQITHM
ncbi:hypothetical protein GW17_00002160 [Ensete ventricosum]|nr:hypothetical protein GW17_00002160 [Ensete ventricosum]